MLEPVDPVPVVPEVPAGGVVPGVVLLGVPVESVESGVVVPG